MIASSLVAIFVFTVIVKYIMHMIQMESYVKNLPCMRPIYPLVGNLFAFVGKSHKEIFKYLVDIVQKQDTPMKAYLGPIFMIVIDRPEDCKTILTSPHCLDKPLVMNDFRSEFVLKIIKVIDFLSGTSTNFIQVKSGFLL